VSTVRGHVDERLVSLIDPIATAVDHGVVARGAVFEIRQEGEVIVSCGIGSDGLGAPVGPETLFAVYCSAKPVVALAVGLLVEAQELSWDDQLADLVEDELALAGDVGQVTVAQLLTHTAGLYRLRADEMLRRSPHDRRAVASQHGPPAGWSPTTDLAYSNFLGWYWLVRVIEAITGGPASAYITGAVLTPLGLTDDIFTGFRLEDTAGAAARCGVNVDLTGSRPVPMLLERSPSFMGDPDLAAAGGYATVQGLCAFYEELMTVLAAPTDASGRLPRHLIETMVGPVVTGRQDPVLGRGGPWGLGFMVDLRHHSFGDHASPRSFGHSGNAGSSFAFCDPAHDLSVAVLYTAKVDDRFAVHIRRHGFLSKLYETLDLFSGTSSAAPGRRVRES
jgi:CubicO group peptidase (beta-lactamase class C family)